MKTEILLIFLFAVLVSMIIFVTRITSPQPYTIETTTTNVCISLVGCDNQPKD